MTKINPPKFSSPELQKAVDAARPVLEGADDAKTRLSKDLKELENYLRECGLSETFRMGTGKGFAANDADAAALSLDMAGHASGWIEEEALLWSKDQSGRFRLLYELCRWDGDIDVDAPGGPYHWDDTSLLRDVKPLVEAPFEIRKRMYETHVVDFVNAIVKQVRIDRPKSASERAGEFMRELSSGAPKAKPGKTSATPQTGAAKTAAARNPSTASGANVVRGTSLSSRRNVQAEIEEMGSIVISLPQEVACHLETVFCDSKASAWYSVKLKQGAPFERTAEALHNAFIAAGGFNGLQVVAANGATRDFAPWWPDADADGLE